MKPQRIKLQFKGFNCADLFDSDDFFHFLFNSDFLDIGLNKPNPLITASFERIISTVKVNEKETWYDGQEFQKKILDMIINNIPCHGDEPHLKDIESMKRYWNEYGPPYFLKNIETKDEIIKNFIGTCYTIAFMLHFWNNKLFKDNFVQIDVFEIVKQILASTDDLTDPSRDPGQYYIYLSLWDDKNQFNPTWKSFVQIPWVDLINNYENGLDGVLDAIKYTVSPGSTDIIGDILKNKKIMDEPRYHSPEEYKRWNELLETAENKFWELYSEELDASLFQQTFFPIFISSNHIELKNLEKYLFSSDSDSCISWLKTACINSISAVLALHPARLVTSVHNDKVSFSPQIDNNIIYFLTEMIEKLSNADYCEYCGNELNNENKISGKKRRFCNEACYDKFRYNNNEIRRTSKNINDYIHNTLKNRQGKVNLEFKNKLYQEANKLLNENKNYNDVRVYVKKKLDEAYPIK
ncbi:hypothetical protein [Pelosinus propionicus]|uniref:Uncharacterized protein n=1 Tax=Pelosinus propionicus DSM 13327 TaxID=1123291 RepID=A0A1I4PSV2_9FIRM|nr:hypothetical protein [Pelosinus propionicus]SFM30922.1 hypothetical protein SAMN04490355_107214 [Pelosinus propionicus DSM 13327]